jgi:hypothetical protein
MARSQSMNPWLKIWTKPRETIAEIVSVNPKSRFIILSAIYGFPFLLNTAQSLSLYVAWPLLPILIVALVLSVFAGMALISLTSLLMLWSGKWLGGLAPYLHIRAAVSWSNVPNLVNVISWLIMIAVFGAFALSPDFAKRAFTGPELALVSVLFFAQLVSSVWSIVILITGLAEVQKFSIWKAILNIIISIVLMAVIIWLVMAVVGVFFGSTQMAA